LVDNSKFVIFLDRKHSINTQILESYFKNYTNQPFIKVQNDTSCDLRCEYEGSIYNYTCVMQ